MTGGPGPRRHDPVRYVDLVAQHQRLRAALHQALDRVLDHGQFVLGPEVAELESRLASQLGAVEVVSCGSGADALQLALRLRGVGPGDEVITVSHSFVATAHAVRLLGATPVFVDIDERTMCMDPGAAEQAVSPRTRAILPVHLNGYPCDMAPFRALCERFGLALVEDAAQALGARRDGEAVGARGLACFSLHPLKVLSALGDAGFVAIDSAADAQELRRLRNHGLQDRDRCLRWGPNSRIDTLQAAFLLVKLPELAGWLEARRAHAAAYRQALAGLVTLPPEEPGVDCCHSAFVIRHPQRDRLREALAARGIDARVHYPHAIHQQPPYTGVVGRLPVTERVVAQILSLPVSPELDLGGRERVIAAVVEAVGSCADV